MNKIRLSNYCFQTSHILSVIIAQRHVFGQKSMVKVIGQSCHNFIHVSKSFFFCCSFQVTSYNVGLDIQDQTETPIYILTRL